MDKTARSSDRTATAQLVAANLDAELTRQRWSDRKAAIALGLTNVYVSRRTSGDVECSASDLVMFAEFLNIPVSKFFEGIGKAPSRGGLRALLPDLDSNQEPAGFKPAPETRAPERLRPVVRLADRRSPSRENHPAGRGVVLPFHGRAGA